MKTYKDFEKQYIGSSDIAALIMSGYRNGDGLVAEILSFGEDNVYDAYIVTDPKAEIGCHYSKVASFNNWLKIYDDTGLSYNVEGSEINIYRSEMYGCIIQIVQ